MSRPKDKEPQDKEEVFEDPLVIVDGRQSPRAAAIQRGVCRHLLNMGYSPLTELPLKTGRRVDVAGLNKKGEIVIVEIKSNLADFQADHKWEEYLPFCDRFYFAVDIDFPQDVLPENVGLIIADRYGAEVMCEGSLEKLATSRRKAVTLHFARAAARRAHRLIDPDL